ncbi:unnamed protein product [Umbelopsis vinacea]
MVRKKPNNNLVRDDQSLTGRSDTTMSMNSSKYIDEVMETSSVEYYAPPTQRKETKNQKNQQASPSLPSVYRRRATPISDSDFEQPADRIIKMPSKKKQLMLTKKFQPSKHVLRKATPSSDEEIEIDLDGPFFFDQSHSPGVGPSTITVNDIFTPSPIHSARLLSPFAGDERISPSASPPGKGKAKASTNNFTSRISSLVSSLLPDSNKKQRPTTPPLPLGQRKGPLSPSSEDNQRPEPVRIITRQELPHAQTELNRMRAENVQLQVQLATMTTQNEKLLLTIADQSTKLDQQSNEISELRISMTSLDNNLKTMAQQYTLLVDKLQNKTAANDSLPSSNTAMEMDYPSGDSIHAPGYTDIQDDAPSAKDSMHAPKNSIASTNSIDERPWNRTAIAKLNGKASAPRFPPPPPAPKLKQQQQLQQQKQQQPQQTLKQQQQQPRQQQQQQRQPQQQQQPPKKSYADIAKKITGDKPEANILAAKSALAFLHQRRPTNTSRTEQRMNVRRIYVNGIPRTTYKTLKQHLFSLHFMLSKIQNVSYIAQNCVEFLVNEEYAQSFLNRCKECNLRTIEVDPTKPLDPNFPIENLPAVKQLFAQRIARIIENTNNDLVKSFFIGYAKELDVSIPSTTARPTTTASVPDMNLTNVSVDSNMTEVTTDIIPSAITENSTPSDQ